MEMNFWQHLAELRKRLMKVLAAVGLGFVGSLFFSKTLLLVLTYQAGNLVFLRPAEALIAQMKLALWNGLVVAAPVILWQLGAFLWPALYPRERQFLGWIMSSGFILFCAGLAFGYWVVVRLGYRFLLSFATANIRPMISLETYLAFIMSVMVLCGLIFIMPLVILLLTRLGLIKASLLWRHQKLLIIGLAVAVAVITPTVDWFSMILVLVPVLLLLEISILLSWWIERRAKKRQNQSPDHGDVGESV
ncbi:sec-independent protein translocase protein TatC [Hydrogenispora ethanolica]|uniref:Sec-independent protein translocase protein TatC n=1 Tax=Hydrogenispora ethanolica TaxID=1082276 RepID=A0A4R1QUT1_HYDET|nr:twin-arginine translocase subunit TatC [Hydrogenispora ethanolica]TCL57726.1 sec-independent protein translocase protein TatC [Hydrogenispora ethanolica]